MVKIDTTISFGTTHTFIAHVYPASPRVQDVRKNWCDEPNTFPHGPHLAALPETSLAPGGRKMREPGNEVGDVHTSALSFRFLCPRLQSEQLRSSNNIQWELLILQEISFKLQITDTLWENLRMHTYCQWCWPRAWFTFHANLVPRDFFTFQTRAIFEKRPGEGPGNELAVHANTRLPFLCLHSEQHFNWKKAFTMNNRRTVCTVDENASRSMHFQTKTH